LEAARKEERDVRRADMLQLHDVASAGQRSLPGPRRTVSGVEGEAGMTLRLEQLDQISKVRSLTEAESLELEREIRQADGDRLPHKLNRALARRGVKRGGRAMVRPDPRMRRVLAAKLDRQDWHVELECGHSTRRRLLALPKQLVCVECPPAGGLGGTWFGKQR
jgi:hypothetical protein